MRKKHLQLFIAPLLEATPVYPAQDSDLVFLLVNLLIKPPALPPSPVNHLGADLVVHRNNSLIP